VTDHRAPARYRLDSPDRDSQDRGDPARGLATLVLTIVELLRELMERQAIRRVEDGTVTDEQAERLGRTFMLLNERMDELTEEFGIRREDLNLDLGPLGTLLPDRTDDY
jgi:hypothetical protein